MRTPENHRSALMSLTAGSLLVVLHYFWFGEHAMAGPIRPNDLVRGRGFGVGDQLEVYRPSGTSPQAAIADPWPTDTPLLQGIEFDNMGGVSHNYAGNLLATVYGSPSTGGSLYSLATDGSPTVRKLTAINSSTWPSISTTRVNGISVSPNNQRLALTGADSTRVIIFDYQGGDGTGGGAVSNPRQSNSGAFGYLSPIGTAWEGDNNVLFFAADGSGNGQLLSVSADNPGIVSVKASTAINVLAAATDVEYNPLISPYVYVSVGRFTGGVTTNRLIVFDPRSSYTTVNSLDLSPLNAVDLPRTFREIALDLEGNLYLSMFSSGSFSAVVARLDDVVSSPETISKADFHPSFFVSTLDGNFAQLDVALPEPWYQPTLLGCAVILLLQKKRGAAWRSIR